MSLEKYWNYATSYNKHGQPIYHGPEHHDDKGHAGYSAHHYGVLSGAWDSGAYFAANKGYDHISMYDASQDRSGTYYYGGEWKQKNHKVFPGVRKDVIGYDSSLTPTLSKANEYFTKWLARDQYSGQDTTGRQLTTYGIDHINQKQGHYDPIGGAVEVINFDQYMNDVGYAEAAEAMGIDKYETLEQIHNAMGYMQGTWQPPADEEENPVADEDEDFERIGDGEDSDPIINDQDGDGIEDTVIGIADEEQEQEQEDTFDYQTAYEELVAGQAAQQEGFDTLLEQALADQDTNFQTQLENALSGQADSYATQLSAALGNQQAGFDIQLSAMNSAMTSYQEQMRLMNEEALRAQEQMRIQAAYGDPGNVTGAQVVGVSEADDDDELVTLGATGSFGRDGLRISSLNI